MRLMGVQAQPYQRLETDRANEAATAAEGDAMLGGMDDGTRFSMLRFLQFCGSG